jgi:hypothetical protein
MTNSPRNRATVPSLLTDADQIGILDDSHHRAIWSPSLAAGDGVTASTVAEPPARRNGGAPLSDCFTPKDPYCELEPGTERVAFYEPSYVRGRQ